jgi:hypothetical protein
MSWGTIQRGELQWFAQARHRIVFDHLDDPDQEWIELRWRRDTKLEEPLASLLGARVEVVVVDGVAAVIRLAAKEAHGAATEIG